MTIFLATSNQAGNDVFCVAQANNANGPANQSSVVNLPKEEIQAGADELNAMIS